jgi:hypothetical protein
MDIGLRLDLKEPDLTAIEEQYSSIGRRFKEMLTLWLKQVNSPRTWTAMVAALQHKIVGEGGLAEQVESKYANQSSKTSYVTDSGPATESQEGEFIVGIA